jgi:ABC-2 type transport system permease protein
MLTDIVTIIRKEWKEIFLQRGGWRGGLLNQLVLLGILGVFFPLQMGPNWLTSPISAISWIWMPIIMSMNMVTDAFAGERERHTLETLLASRLSDRAILFGKILASVLYGFAVAALAMLLGAITVNLAHPRGQLQFYSLAYFVAGNVILLEANTLMAALGSLVSLKAQTARQAYQQLSVGLLVLMLVPFIGFQVAPPAWKQGLEQMLSGNSTPLVIGVIGVLGLTCAALIAAAMARFQRARLIDL